MKSKVSSRDWCSFFVVASCRQIQIPRNTGGAKSPVGMPNSLGNFTWGCQISRGAGLPVTQEQFELAASMEVSVAVVWLPAHYCGLVCL